MQLPEDPEGFARLLARTIPGTAAAIRSGDRSGYAWPGRASPGAEGILDLPIFACVDDRGRASTGLCYGPDGALEGFVAWPMLRDLGLSGARPLDETRGPPPAGADAFATRFAAGLDYPALRAAAHADAGDPEAYAWLAAPGPDGERRRSFARDFPWALDAMVESGRELWDDPDADAVCDLVRSSSPAGAGPPRTLRRLVEATRGLSFPDLDRRSAMRGVRAASLLPMGWIPDDPEDVHHLVLLAPHVVAHAVRSGLPVGEAWPSGRDWGAGMSRLLDAAGLRAGDAPLRLRISGLAVLVEDMLDAFSEQVLRPAAADAGWPLGEGEALRASHRMILGRRSFPGAVDTALRWRSRRTPAAEALAGLAERCGLSWPAPFPPLGDRLGLVAVPLLTPRELVEEGRALGHCVARYLPACLSGERSIVSIRGPARPGEERERLSTLELGRDRRGRLVPLQHRGPGNGPPPDVAVMAARRIASALSSGALPSPPGGNGEARAALAAVYRSHPRPTRNTWAPVLGRDLVEASPEQLLAAAGIAAPDAPGPR